MIKKCSKDSKLLVSVEDHNIIGGLGSAIAEVLTSNEEIMANDKYCKRLIRMGIKDTFGKSGKPESLMKYFEIDREAIEECIKSSL